MRWLRTLRIAALGVLAAVVSLAPSRDSLAEVPVALTYQGVLLDKNGQPITGTRNVVVRLWDDPLSTASEDRIYEEVHLDVPLSDGAFEVRVGEGRFPSRPFDAAIFDAEGLWVEVEIGSEILSPRKRLGSVARAMRADKARFADQLGDLGEEDVQQTVSDTCPAGSAMRSIPADGLSPVCEADDNTQYTAGSGLVLVGSQLFLDINAMQLRIGGSCPAGQAIRTVQANGAVVCDVDDDTNTTYSASTGLALTGTALGIENAGVTATGLAASSLLNSALATGSVDSRVVLNDTLTAFDLALDSVGASEIRAGAVGADEISDAGSGVIDSARVQDGTLTGADFAPASLASLDFSNEAGGESASPSNEFLSPVPVFVVSNQLSTPPGGGIAIVRASGHFSFQSFPGASDLGECKITTGTMPGGTSSVATMQATSAGAGLIVFDRSFLLTGGVAVAGSSTIQFNLECRRTGTAGAIGAQQATMAVLFLPTRY